MPQVVIALPKGPEGFGMAIDAEGGVPSYTGENSVAQAGFVPLPSKI
eukprot:SAG22_NODE_22156_length_251_cov_0.671053_1_plen_46_part_01